MALTGLAVTISPAISGTTNHIGTYMYVRPAASSSTDYYDLAGVERQP